MFGTKIGDTAYYDPDLRSPRPLPRQAVHHGHVLLGHGEQRIDEYATGTSGFHGAEGTWRDAEDGHLQGNAIAQGAVDSTISHHVHVSGPTASAVVYMVMVCAGKSRDELLELHKWIIKQTPAAGDRPHQQLLAAVGRPARTSTSATCRRRWSTCSSGRCSSCERRSTTAGRSSRPTTRDIMQFARDTYSYVWPRDGALVADSLDLAGFPDIARWFYSFCSKTHPPRRLLLSQVQPRRLAGQQLAPVGDPQPAGDADPGGRDGAGRLGHVAALLPLPRHRVRPPAVGGCGAEGRRLHVRVPRPAHRVAAAKLRPVGGTVGRPRVHGGHRVRRPEGGPQLRRLLRRPREGRAVQQGRRGGQGRGREVHVERQAEPIRPPARSEGQPRPAGR